MGVSPRRKKILLEVDVLTDVVMANLLPPHSTTASTLKIAEMTFDIVRIKLTKKRDKKDQKIGSRKRPIYRSQWGAAIWI